MFRLIKKKYFIFLVLLFSTTSHSIGFLDLIIFDPTWGFINNKSIVNGYVYSRGVYKNKDGIPVFVIYGLKDGETEEIKELGPAEGIYNNAKVHSYTYISSLLTIIEDTQNDYDEFYQQQLKINSAQVKENLLFSRVSFESLSYTNALGIPVPLPDLKPDTKSVIINPKALNYSELSSSIIFKQFEIDFTDSSYETLDSATNSILVNELGKLITSTKNNERIGYRSIFFHSPSSVNQDVFYSSATRHGNLNKEQYPLVNPISGVGLDAIPVIGADVTSDDGYYSFVAMMSPCPLFNYSLDPYISGQMYYRAFNPRHNNPYWYFLGQTAYMTCLGSPGIGLVAPNLPVQIHNIDFPIDLTIIQGSGILEGVEIDDNTSQDVVYDDSKPEIIPIKIPFDFNFDGTSDIQYCGHFEDKKYPLIDQSIQDDTQNKSTNCNNAETNAKNYYEDYPLCFASVFITDIDQSNCYNSSTAGFGFTTNPMSSKCQAEPLTCQPSFTRVLDYSSTAPETYVKSMTRDQLRNTDIFVIRESSGQLVSMRQGLKEDEYGGRKGSSNNGGVKADASYFGYHMRFNGRHDIAYFFDRDRWKHFDQWQAGANMNPKFYDLKKADHIKPGENLKVVLINRATGYIGSSNVSVHAAGDDIDLLIDTQVDTIVMYPPNLKVWAERKYDVEYGATQGDTKEYLIGAEGAGEADDTTIQLYTEWLDHNGLPLPAALSDYGYTGRLASITAENNLSEYNSSALPFARFPIRPGKNVQLLKLPSTSALDNRHFYVQVSGTAYNDAANQNYDFSLGANTTTADFEADPNRDRESILRYRPAKFVPIKTPKFNELQSVENMKAFYSYKQNLEYSNQPTDHLVKPEPSFDWLARPDYQFSVYDLKVKELNVSFVDQSTESILENTTVLITADTDTIQILYEIIGSDFDPLSSYQFEENKTLILAIGAQEYEVFINEKGELKFSDLSALQNMNAEDFISIQLYLNNDSQNILWEWAFTSLDLDIDSNNDNGFDLPQRSESEESLEIGHAGKFIPVNNGDINRNSIPDFAEFDYGGADLKFVPFVLELPSEMSVRRGQVTFKYDGSNPLNVTQQVDDETKKNYYKPASGSLRLWSRNANEIRNPAAYTNSAGEGHYIEPNKIYLASELGFTEGEGRIKTFYIEALLRSQRAGDAAITVEVNY